MKLSEYYSMACVERAMCRATWDKDFSVIGKYESGARVENRTIRGLSVRDSYSLRRIQQRFKLNRQHKDKHGSWVYCRYKTVTRIHELPKFSYKLGKVRNDETGAWYSSQACLDSIAEIDCNFDFDMVREHVNRPKVWDRLFAVSKKVTNLLDECQVPYSTQFSGFKGQHVTIPFKALPTQDEFAELTLKNRSAGYYLFCKQLAEEIKYKFDDHRYKHPIKFNKKGKQLKQKTGFVDLQGCSNMPSRLMKVPFSVCESGKVVLPLTREDIQNFSIEKMNLDKVIETHNIRKITDSDFCMRFNNLSVNKMRQNFREFCRRIKNAKRQS